MRNIQRKIVGIVLSAPFLFSFLSCSNSGSSNSALALLALSNRNANVLGRYADLAYISYGKAVVDATSMQNAIETFIANPTAGNLTAAKNAWVVARASYLVTEPFRFSGGPIDAEAPGYCGGTAPYSGTDGCEGSINAWPLDEIVIDNYIQGKADANAITFTDIYSKNGDPTLAAGGDDQNTDHVVMTGYHAIEYLLWGRDLTDTGSSSSPVPHTAGTNLTPGLRDQTYLSDATYGARRKKYLSEVVKGLIGHLTQVRDQWTPGVSGNYRVTFLADSASLTNVFNGLGEFIASEWGGDRLAGIDTKVQEQEHSCFSDTTKADFYYDAQGFLNIWTGNYSIVKGVNLSSGAGLSSVVSSATSNFVLNDATQARDAFCINLDDETADPNYKTTVNCSANSLSERYDQVIMHSEFSSSLQQGVLSDLKFLLSTTLNGDFANAINEL